MDNKTKGKYEILGMIFSFLALWTCIFIFLGYPVIRNIISNSNEIQKKIIDNDINQVDIKKIPELEKLHQIFVQKQDTLNVLTSEVGEVDFIKNLENLANVTNNTMKIKINDKENGAMPFSDDKASKNTILGSLPYTNYVSFEISLSGNYDDFLKFIEKLENFREYANVVALNISKDEVAIPQNGANNNIFNSGSNQQKQVTAPQSKEILKSVINLVVYVKK